jgi:UDP-N-acetylglucosamine 2-epimerase (non-hydrolysing)
MKKLLHLIAGARPNFMKIAPIVRALRDDGRMAFKIVHTGQHYDREMNQVFFEELGIPDPDIHLGVGGGSHAQQVARIMVAYEEACAAHRPDAVVVVGDVNSTMACAIVAKKLHIPVAHVEAGLRSGDMRMPEEVNRIVTDSICDWFFVTEPAGAENLLREGKPASAIHHVGHVMVDNLLHQVEQLRHADTTAFETAAYKARHQRYGVVTLHRPSNVDHAPTLAGIAQALREVSQELPLAFPVHPRTRRHLEQYGIDLGPDITLLRPQPYMPFLHLWKDAAVVLTDSGGLQEETTALGIPCVTVRENTERPITIEQGTNVLAGTRAPDIVAACLTALREGATEGRRPQLWDGRSALRVVEALVRGLHAP